MSNTTQPTVRRVRDAVVWPDPSPLDTWWHNVMYAETGSGPQKLRTTR